MAYFATLQAKWKTSRQAESYRGLFGEHCAHLCIFSDV